MFEKRIRDVIRPLFGELGPGLAAQSRRFPRAQFFAQYFTGLVLREFAEDLDLPWVLVPQQAFLTEGDDLPGRCLGAGFEGDDGFDCLTEVGVGNADCGCFGDSRVEMQARLNLQGGDVLAHDIDRSVFHDAFLFLLVIVVNLW